MSRRPSQPARWTASSCRDGVAQGVPLGLEIDVSTSGSVKDTLEGLKVCTMELPRSDPESGVTLENSRVKICWGRQKWSVPHKTFRHMVWAVQGKRYATLNWHVSCIYKIQVFALFRMDKENTKARTALPLYGCSSPRKSGAFDTVPEGFC